MKMIQPNSVLLDLWLVVLVTLVVSSAASASATTTSRGLQQPSNENDNTNQIWGYQQGSSNGHTDAGGMVYDIKRDEIILTGTTHDTQFFADDGANGVDCFIATIKLPNVADEIDAKEQALASPQLVAAAEAQRKAWTLSGKQRVATANVLDRCDLIASVWATSVMGVVSHDHTFIGGTLAVNQNSQRDPISVQPLLYEATINNFSTEGVSNYKTKITTGEPMKLFEAPPFGQTGGGNPLAIPKKNDIIIPAMMTGDVTHSAIYIASVHRILVLHSNDVGSSNARPKLQISLGIAKFKVTDDPREPLVKEWSHIEPTTMLEVKASGNDVPHVTSGMFHANPGKLTPSQQHEMDMEQAAIEEEIDEIEAEQEAYEEEEMQLDVYRHEYKNDGVLISGLEMVQMPDDRDSFLLIAGSAPGTKQGLMGHHSNHSMTGAHPFMPHAPSYQTNIGDWDGYVAKLSPRTGAVVQANLDINTWGYRLHSQPKRNDFIQSICVPKLPEGIKLSSNARFYPEVAYAVGTTNGKLAGDQYGGAFLVQIDLISMDVNWKQQIPGMNVHGMSCQVLVDVASHGTTIRSESKDLIYLAGEVHGQMKVPMANGQTLLTHGHGETDVFVAQLRASDGKVVWVQQVGTSQQDRLAKNINNPSVSDGEQESDIGDTGGGKGALVIDREGNAIVYGTTNGSLGRTKAAGDRFRDIFVVRLHRDDGSYKVLMESQKYEHTAATTTTTTTPSPVSGPAPALTPGGIGPSSSQPIKTGTTSSSANPPKLATHKGAVTDTSVDPVIIIAGLAIPVVLGMVIILATNKRTPRVPTMNPNHMPSTPMSGATLHVDFPSQQQQQQPEGGSSPYPPRVEQSLEMSPTTTTTTKSQQQPTATFGVL